MKHSLNIYWQRVGALTYIPTTSERAYMKSTWADIIKDEKDDIESTIDLANYYCAQLDFINAAISAHMPKRAIKQIMAAAQIEGLLTRDDKKGTVYFQTQTEILTEKPQSNYFIMK